MRVLLIALPILAALLLLLLAKLRITLSYGTGLTLSVRYLLFRFSLYPRKKKARQKKRKKKKVSLKKATPGVEKKKTGSKSKPKKRLSFGDVRFLLRVLRETLAKILDKASRHVRITLRELRITIGGERDAAVAAIEYGLLSQAVSYLLAYLDYTTFLKPPKDDAIDLRIDFTDRGHTLSTRIDISCPLIFLIPLLFSSLTHALAAKGRWSRHRTASANRKNATPKAKENENGRK